MAFKAHEIEYQPRPPSARDAMADAPDESSTPLARDEAADLLATTLIRGALVAVFIYEAAHLIIGVLIVHGATSRFFALHAAGMALTAAAFGLTWTSLYRNHWRELMFAEVSAITIGAISLGASAGSPAHLFTTAMMLQIGTAAVVPWGMRWQAGYAAVCAAAAIVAASLVPISNQFMVYRWLELGAASGIALFVAAMSQNYRDEIRQRMSVLQANEEKLWKIFDANPDVVTIASYPEGRHLNVSNQFLRTGYTRDEIIGATARERHLWADESQLAVYEERLKANGQVYNMEAAFRLKNGTLVPCLISGVVVRLSHGPCVVSVTRDISRIKRAERELIAARMAAEAASHAKSEFLSSMSHEIRTPMNAILGMAEVLADSDLSGEQRKYLSIMMSNGNALLDLINDILDLARVESGMFSLERADFDLYDLSERVAETLSIRAHQKGLELVVRIAPEVPAALIGDPLRLRQVLVNLIGNAIKFTDRGEIVLGVEADSRAEPGLLHFTVSDTGIGIARENIDGIFTSYAQADQSTARKYGGTGLGLAIVKRLVELMGGRIWVESEVGNGSRFHFTARFGLQPVMAAPGESSSLKDVRVLVADDSAVARRALCDVLAGRGAHVSEAENGEKALALVNGPGGNEFSVILLDCGMAGTDGGARAFQMGAARPDGATVIPMLTTDDLNIRLPALRRAGFLNHLIKPIRRAELFSVIADAIGKRAPAAAADSRQESAASAPNAIVPEPSREDAAAPADTAAPAPVASAERPLRVLVADDSPDNRLLIEAFVRKAGWALDQAEDGEAAVQKFIAGSYDVVLMDIQMPVMDGYAAARRIREWESEHNARRTPIIALTASVLDEAVGKSFEAGCDTHVSKPVRRPTLLSAIREVTTASAGHGDTIAKPGLPGAPRSRKRRDWTRGKDAKTPAAPTPPPLPGVTH
jgi:PAS domain S-box-containing protein